MLSLNLAGIPLKLSHLDEKASVFDPIRKKWVILTPEEHVRQLLIQYLVATMQYPAGLMAVEKTITTDKLNKRFDIVIYNREHKPWMLVECKEPGELITDKTLHQLLNYQRSMQCDYWLLTNGRQAFCADAKDVTNIKWITVLPEYAFQSQN
jgi:hypothetical protein